MKYQMTKKAWESIGKQAGWSNDPSQVGIGSVYSTVLDKDIDVRTDYNRYHGTTPAMGPDPDDIKVYSITVSKDVFDNEGNIVIPEGANLYGKESFLADKFGINIQGLLERL